MSQPGKSRGLSENSLFFWDGFLNASPDVRLSETGRIFLSLLFASPRNLRVSCCLGIGATLSDMLRKMKQTSVRKCAGALLALFLAWMLSWPPAAHAETIPGDFEAKVVLSKNGYPVSLPISVSILVASPNSAAPKFSGRVSVGVFTQAITGTLSAPPADSGDSIMGGLVATVSNLKQIPPFTVRYYPPSPASEFDEATPEGMVLSFGNSLIEYDYVEFVAKPAAMLSPDSNGKSWTLTDAFAGAFKFRADAWPFEALDSKIEGINGLLASSADLIAAGSSELSALQSDLKYVQTELVEVKKTADALAPQVAKLRKAESGVQAAERALEKAVDTSATAFAQVILKNLPDPEMYNEGLKEEAKMILSEFTDTLPLDPLLSVPGGFGELEGALRSRALWFKTFLASTTLESFLENVSSSADFTDGSFSRPFSAFSFETLAQAKAVLTSYNTQTLALISSAKAVSSARYLRDSEQQNVSLEDLGAAEEADAAVQRANESVEEAKSLLAQKMLEVEGVKAQQASLNGMKATYLDAKSLAGFAGYGTYQAGVRAVSSTASKPTAVTAAFLGTTPDGQKFTYSAKLRAEDEASARGVFLLNAAAGKRGIVADITYAVDSDSVSALATASENVPVWAGLELQQTLGAALLPAKVTDGSREDVGRAMNVFGGPFDESGNVASSKTAVSSVVVAVGEPEETGAVSGFGAQITSANLPSKLLVAKKGSALKLTPSLVSAASFSGAFPYNGTVAKPFTGVFFRVEEGDSGPGVRGYGSLVASPTASVPVEVFVSSDSGEGQQPEPPEAPAEPLVVWTGLSSGSLSLQITDMPAGLNVTTVRLYKGTKLVGSAEAAADGRVLLPTKGLVAGPDYAIQVSREFVSGVFESDRSSEFGISVRSLPVYTYQTLLGPGDGLYARNGMQYQGRLTVTTTATGAWTGKLDWVSLTRAVDSTGQPSSYTFSSLQGEMPVYIPAIVSYPLKGQLGVPGDTEDLSELRSSVTIPIRGQPGHQLVVSIGDGSAEGPIFGPAPSNGVGLRLNATLALDPSFEEQSTQYGQTYASVKGVAGAKGKYSTISIRNGEAKNNHSHTFDYAGAGTAIYTFQTGTGSAKLTSTANVALDGGMPFLVGGVLAKGSLRYQNASGANVTAPMAIVVAGAMRPTIGLNITDNKYWVGQTILVGGGCELEISTKSKGGYVLRDEWVNAQPSNGEHWGFGGGGDGDGNGNSDSGIAATKRYVDFLPEEKLVAGTPYAFELILGDSPALTDTVTFSTSGIATFSDPTTKSLVTLSASLSTGEAKAVVKLTDRELMSTGKPRTVSGFAVTGWSLLGWGGIEGGDVGWRIRAQ